MGLLENPKGQVKTFHSKKSFQSAIMLHLYQFCRRFMSFVAILVIVLC
jgi:hypothetical protein